MLLADFRARERFVLLTGAAAVSLLTLVWVLGIAGHGLGSFFDRFGLTLVLLYLCSRFWAHAQTLADRQVHEALAKVGVLAAPVVFLLLLAQTWTTAGIHLSLGLGALPQLHISLFTRLEWTADIAVFALFLATAIAVWTDADGTASALLSKVAYAVLGLLALDLLAAVWGVISVVPQWRLVFALFALALGGTILIATVRRLERLDEAA
jgi:hypothetical protein